MTVKNPIVAGREFQALRRALGPAIAGALADPRVVEVMVNPDGRIWIDRIAAGRLALAETITADATETIIRLIAHHVGEEANSNHPMVAGVLPETGERFQGLLPPITRAPVFAIRKRPEVIFSLDDYVRDRILERRQAALLREAATKRENILIAGGTGSGKTTLANAILAEPAFAGDRVILIEDTPELQCAAEDRVEKLTRRTPPAISMRDLVQATLRMRPDRIIIGEVRGAEAFDMLQAMNTGHDGSMTTVHANSARDALGRIEQMVTMIGLDLPLSAIRAQVASGVNIVIHVARLSDGSRRLLSISEITGLEGSVITMQDIFVFRRLGLTEEGAILGELVPTGIRPLCADTLINAGVDFDPADFVLGRS
jgi:type IV secretion system protein VirB11